MSRPTASRASGCDCAELGARQAARRQPRRALSTTAARCAGERDPAETSAHMVGNPSERGAVHGKNHQDRRARRTAPVVGLPGLRAAVAVRRREGAAAGRVPELPVGDEHLPVGAVVRRFPGPDGAGRGTAVGPLRALSWLDAARGRALATATPRQRRAGQPPRRPPAPTFVLALEAEFCASSADTGTGTATPRHNESSPETVRPGRLDFADPCPSSETRNSMRWSAPACGVSARRPERAHLSHDRQGATQRAPAVVARFVVGQRRGSWSICHPAGSATWYGLVAVVRRTDGGASGRASASHDRSGAGSRFRRADALEVRSLSVRAADGRGRPTPRDREMRRELSIHHGQKFRVRRWTRGPD
jgi:hypothetical protein